MAGSTAGLARVTAPADWLLGSPRVRRLLALQTGVLLASGVVGAMALQRPPSLATEPLALVSALRVSQAEALAKPLGAPPAAAPVSRSSPHPRPRLRPTTTVARPVPKKPVPKKLVPKKKPAPKRPVVRDWAYWAPRIRHCESSGDYRALNPDTGASGAYQILDTTWEGRYAVEHAADATPAQQDAAAAELYRRWGTRPWAESAACWR